jgi:hypothetical protein
MSVIVATGEAEIRRIAVGGQTQQKVSKAPFQSINFGHGGVLSSQLCGTSPLGFP